jgi:hypothetical protein
MLRPISVIFLCVFGASKTAQPDEFAVNASSDGWSNKRRFTSVAVHVSEVFRILSNLILKKPSFLRTRWQTIFH